MLNLTKVYDDLLQGLISLETAADEIKSKEVRKTINALINKESINENIPYSEEDLMNIQAIVNITQYIFNNSGLDTGLTDTEYDKLYSILLFNGGNDISSAPILFNTKKIGYHKYPMIRGSLDKVYYLGLDGEKKINSSRRELDSWISSMERLYFERTGEQIDLNEEEIYVFPKFDGLSTVLEMNKQNRVETALTRGYTENNEAKVLTHIFSRFPKRESAEFGEGVEYGLQCEIMMTNSKLEEYNKNYNKTYKNTRSVVASILNSDDVDDYLVSLLEVVPLRVCNSEGEVKLAQDVFERFPYIKCRLKDREIIDDFSKKNKFINDELRCDGSVLYIINEKIQKVLGRDNHINNFEVAYKFTEESTKSKIKKVNFTLGLFGRLTPVAEIEPIVLKGNTIENISLGSIGRLIDLNLHVGDEVIILYDIIPYLNKDETCKENKKGKMIKIPENCPECNSKLNITESGLIYSCTNDDCPCRMQGRILNYIQKMDIEGLSYASVKLLYDNGYLKSIKDLYRLEDNQLKIIKLPGIGYTTFMNWLKAIEDRSVVKDFKLLGSLGISNASRRVFKKVTEKYSIEELLDIAKNNEINKLVEIDSIGEITAKNIIDGLNKNKKLIKFLLDELTIESTDDSNLSIIAPFRVCFTKVRDKKLEELVEELGGEVVDGISKSTTFLVVPDEKTKSSKVDKAIKYGTKVVPIDKFEDVLKDYLKQFITK